MKSSSSKIKQSTKFTILAVALLAIGVAIGFYAILTGNRTYTSQGSSGYSIEALTCKATQPDEAFFTTQVDGKITHAIKATIKDDKIDKIAYNFYGVFADTESANKVSSSLHADYNIYMGNSGLSAEVLTPSFLATDTAVNINLYANSKDLSDATAKLFFLTNLTNISSYDKDNLKKFYEGKGFVCTFD